MTEAERLDARMYDSVRTLVLINKIKRVQLQSNCKEIPSNQQYWVWKRSVVVSAHHISSHSSIGLVNRNIEGTAIEHLDGADSCWADTEARPPTRVGGHTPL